MKQKIQKLFAEYGWVFFGTYLATFVVTFTALVLAIKFGFQVEGTAGTAGTLGAAYVGAQASKIIRIPIAAALTPLVARVLRYKKKNPAEATPERPRENAEG